MEAPELYVPGLAHLLTSTRKSCPPSNFGSITQDLTRVPRENWSLTILTSGCRPMTAEGGGWSWLVNHLYPFSNGERDLNR